MSRAPPKATKLEREGHLGIEDRAGDGETSRIDAAEHTQHRRVKIGDGGDGNDVAEVIRAEPEGAGTHEGTRTLVAGNTEAGVADPGLEQGFEVDASSAGAGGDTGRTTAPTAREQRISTRDRGWPGGGSP
jgi:hypothetical protein